MPIIGLRDWDTSGELSPYKKSAGDQLLGGLKTILEQTTKAAQDKQLRQAAAGMLGIDPNSLRGYTSEEIKGIMTDATKEKFKASMEETKTTAKAKAESEGLRNLLNMFPGQTGEPAITGDILLDTQTAQPGGLNITPGDILKGRLKKQYGIDLTPNFEQEKFEMEKQKFEAEQEKSRIEKEEKVRQQEAKSNFIKQSTQDALNTIAEVKKGKEYFGAVGPVPTLNPWGYDRKKWEANVNKLLAGKMVELMTQMKEASKTGATGFGQLSEREGQILRDAATALNRGLSPQDAEGYLNEMERILKKIVSNEQQGTQPNTFNTEEEAIASGIKGEVFINGRRARID